MVRKYIIHNFQYGKNKITLETGRMARKTNAAVMVNMEETAVFVTVVEKKNKKGNNFFPLNVIYQERTYAAGRIPGSFFRREGRQNEREILISRLIDRPIRPLFPDPFRNEVQVIATVVSINPKINADIVAMIGVSATLSLSGIPLNGPIGAARIGYINDQYVLNPTTEEIKKSSVNMVVSGKYNTVLMVESEANILSEEKIIGAVFFGQEQQKVVIDNINEFVAEVGTRKWMDKKKEINEVLHINVAEISSSILVDAYTRKKKKNISDTVHLIKKEVQEIFFSNKKLIEDTEILDIISSIEKNIVRNRILRGETRIDGREKDMIRSLDMRIGILPRTHGSAIFTRGETQALVTVTLGTARDAQNIDELIGEKTDKFLFHYNFPPYSVGEIGIIGSPKRREIGHGRLAKRGVLAMMPKQEKFPYTVRVVSEITESNGSSSMASVCGASLALMDAGVPIKSAIAGIAIGLIKEEEKFIILSDILGDEDHLGDMDLKVAGSREGITALQMDMKIEGITKKIIKRAMNQAKGARIHILGVMEKAISKSRKDISSLAPIIRTIHINPDRIKDIIGKGGSMIRMLTEETNTKIEIEDNGTVNIAAQNNNQAKKAIIRIKEITEEIEVGSIYQGKVTRIVDFGAFVIIKGKEGLVHISQISENNVKKIIDYIKVGQIVKVKVLEINRNGRFRLSIKEAK